MVDLTVFLMFIFVSNLSFAQQPELDSEPTSDIEITCFAAKKQWVCAPADQKQQAHEKAIKLAKEQPSEVDLSETNDANVEIKTMDVNNNFREQVQESTTDGFNQEIGTEPKINDLVVKDAANNATGLTENVNLNETVDNNLNEPVNDAQVTIESNDSTSLPVKKQFASNDFKYWKSNYAEKWSFQVIGTSNQHHLDEFISVHNLQEHDYSIVKTEVNSADWWVVLVGLYDSRSQALSRRATLPSALSEQAWVRQIKTITDTTD